MSHMRIKILQSTEQHMMSLLNFWWLTSICSLIPFPGIVTALACEELTFLENGHFSLSTPAVSIGTVANYSCFENYTMIGGSLRTCLRNASWSGTTPVCIRMNCSSPDLIKNGYFNSSNEEINGTYPSGTVLEFKCRQGYSLEGSKRVTCSDDNQWSNTLPKCHDGTLDNRTGGKVKNPTTENHAFTSLHFTSTPSSVTFPHINCPILQDEAKRKAQQINASFVMYVCETGYDLVGKAVIECWQNGSWSDPPPQCVDKMHTTEKAQELTTTLPKDMNSTSAAIFGPSEESNKTDIESALLWKRFFLQTRNWSGTFSNKAKQTSFQFIITDITPDPLSFVKALFTSKDAEFQMEGYTKVNSSATVVFTMAAKHGEVSTLPPNKKWSLEGHLYTQAGVVIYSGQICSLTTGCDSFTMKPDKKRTVGLDDLSLEDNPHGVTLVLGVVIPVSFFIVSMVTAVLICRHRGRVKYGASGTLTSFENPVYDYEQSLR